MQRYSLATQIVERPGLIVSVGAPLTRVVGHPDVVDLNSVAVDIRAAMKVRADDLAVDHWLERDRTVTAANLGPLRAPFDRLWIEWQNPAEYVTDDGEVLPQRTSDGGMLVRGYTLEEWEPFEAVRTEYQRRRGNAAPVNSAERFAELGIEYISYAIHFERWFERNLVAHAGSIAYGLDGAGAYVAHAASTPLLDPRMQAKAVADGADIGQMLIGSAESGMWPGLRALGIMNCKNVDVRLAETPRPRGKKSRRDLPDYDFHTIRLPGVTYLPNGRPAPASDAVLRQHMVRGHFKTYTPERPLLGKAVGTFWWGWQSRGSSEKGTVEHDYQVSS